MSEVEVVVTRRTFLTGLVIAILAASAISTVASMQLAIGPQGPKGDKGDTGAQGLTGLSGTDGVDGKDGVNGTDGLDGKSAYQIWLEQGNVGTEQDFLDSLIGEQGLPGLSPYPKGSILISLLTFDPTGPTISTNIKDLTYVGSPDGVNNPQWAPVQLPQGAFVTNLTALLSDASNNMHVVLELWRFNPANRSSLEQMASVQTTDPDTSLNPFFVYDDSIANAQIDNQNFVYGLKLYSSRDGGSYLALGLRGVKIEYEYKG